MKFRNEYKQLKQENNPLEITVLRCGTFASYREKTGKTLRHINPSIHDIQEMIKMQAAFDGHRRY